MGDAYTHARRDQEKYENYREEFVRTHPTFRFISILHKLRLASIDDRLEVYRWLCTKYDD